MSLESRVLLGLRWSAAGKITGQALSWVATIYVIRILKPEDYGLMSLATIVLVLARLVNELGAIPAFIQRKEPDEFLTRQVFGITLLSNIVLYTAIFFGAPWFARFFEDPRLTLLVRVLSLKLLINALGAVPNAIQTKALRFKGISLVRLCSLLAGSLTSLGLAVSGFGVWALVGAGLTVSFVNTSGLIVLTRFRVMPTLQLSGTRSLLVFGARITAARFVYFLRSQLDRLVIGKLLGSDTLGLYSVAHHVGTLPVSKTMGVVNQIAFPAYSKLQDDIVRAGRYFLRSIEIASALFFPVLWGMSSIAPEIVSVCLGSRWEDSAVLLQIISLSVPLQAIASLLGPVVNGIGRPDVVLRNGLTTTLCLVLGIAVGYGWGITGIACGVVIALALSLGINLRRSLPFLEVTFRQVFRSVMTTALLAAVMYGVVTAARILFLSELAPVWRMIWSISIGASVYVGISAAFNLEVYRRTFRLIRG